MGLLYRKLVARLALPIFRESCVYVLIQLARRIVGDIQELDFFGPSSRKRNGDNGKTVQDCFHLMFQSSSFPMSVCQNESCILVNSTFSSFRVTAAGGLVPGPPPPVKSVCEKLVFTATLRFRYQLSPTDHASAERAEVPGLEKSGNAPL